MESPAVRTAVVVASVRGGRLAPDVAGWFTALAGLRDDLELDVIDLADHELPGSLDAQDPVALALAPRLAGAEAFVLIVPEYNRGVPGPLKTFIDSFQTEWQAKPVGYVSYGLSLSGGVRAVEQLRQIYGEFHAVSMKDAVFFPRVLDHYDARGAFPAEPEGAQAAAKLMLDQLIWWARALRDAKSRRPYGK
ncbi:MULTISPECIES: NAD(P)H-dependent oxidoreductase [unclassified Streptomyces]|uniref:NADPH-dependent FMN reductase n=1 Tax=unclassified Streptomyces TaxID=2593676 RepID=UPI0008238656|nr:NAD(P)H-dependent oxidoreductase [Streptomyces sp. AmelKG-D3]MYT97318.1 NADPH-dependent FMN reductase [Streptomyces sp. SID8350]NGO85887.1 NADPH-dependent FMN reductase [Streptomyces sp. 196(2019)]SCK60646.1 NAD(P)H-dependent FMN reductase [Streptomyces sp. AmelKG-D3]